MQLENRILLVTGADCGFGPAIIEASLREGASVIAQSDVQNADKFNAQMDEEPRVLQLFGDLNIKSNIDTLWADAVAWRGRVDVLVNNADIYTSSPLESPANWELGWKANLSINLEAPAALCRHAMQHFERSDGGIIINLDCRITAQTDTEYLAYYAAKGGLFALSNCISRDYPNHRTLAYAVIPAVPGAVWSVQNCVLAGDYLISSGIPIVIKEHELPSDIAQITTALASGQIGRETDFITEFEELVDSFGQGS